MLDAVSTQFYYKLLSNKLYSCIQSNFKNHCWQETHCDRVPTPKQILILALKQMSHSNFGIEINIKF